MHEGLRDDAMVSFVIGQSDFDLAIARDRLADFRARLEQLNRLLLIALDTDHISILQHEDSPKAIALFEKPEALPEGDVVRRP